MIGIKLIKPITDWDEYAKAAEWCNNNGAYIVEHEDCYEVEAIPEPTFEELKERKLAELSASFEKRVSGSFTTSQGYTMQFSPDDSLKMQGALQLMEATGQEYGYIVHADDSVNENVPLVEMRAVLVEMLAEYARYHAKKQRYRSEINSASNIEELNSIVFDWSNENA